MMKKLLYLILAGIILTGLAYFIVDSYQENLDLAELRASAENLEFIDLNQGKTRVLRLNEQEDSRILLIHGGGTAGSEIWRPNIPFLHQSGADILTYDQLGKGYSDRPAMKYTLANLSKQMNEVLEHTEFSSHKFSIVSHSLGGMLATRYFADHTDNVNKVVLISPNLLGGFQPNTVLKVPVVAELLMTFYWYWGFLDGREIEFYDKQKFREYAELITPFSQTEGFKYVYHRTWLDVLTEDVKQDLLTISTDNQQKVLIIYGKNDPYFNKGTVDELRKFLPDAQYVLIDSVGHNINFEKPDAVNQIIHNFILSDP